MDERAAALSTSGPQKRKKEQQSWKNWQKKVGILITYIHMDNIYIYQADRLHHYKIMHFLSKKFTYT